MLYSLIRRWGLQKWRSWFKEWIFPMNFPLLDPISCSILLSFWRILPRCLSFWTHGSGVPFKMIGATRSWSQRFFENMMDFVFDFSTSGLVLNLKLCFWAKSSQILTMDCRPCLLADNRKFPVFHNRNYWGILIWQFVLLIFGVFPIRWVEQLKSIEIFLLLLSEN